jgi:hypothetical protein
MDVSVEHYLLFICFYLLDQTALDLPLLRLQIIVIVKLWTSRINFWLCYPFGDKGWVTGVPCSKLL